MSTTSLRLPALFLAPIAVAVESESLTLRPGCHASCGGVKVPYPFGIGTYCFRPGFEIACVNKTPALTVTTQVIQVLELSVMPRPEARVMLPVAWQCFNTTTNDVIESFDARLNINPSGVYRISNTATNSSSWAATPSSSPTAGRPPAAAHTPTGTTRDASPSAMTPGARDGACAGIGCYHVDISPGLTDNWMRFYSFTHVDIEFSPCDFAFIVEKGYYSFQEADLHMGPGASHRKMLMRLDWAIRDSNVKSTDSLTCSQAANKPGYTCVSDHSKCVKSINGPGYFCNYSQGYH
ncbi:hypothetical protein CFC21_039433 [Triticum aestivum]|uniref:Wall-associated receptor kinase galacturonan-binding domain-containing protein n=2 Tax=Triticum aestivum TaxID=4565 RepID=A0A9R1FE58_WHEAT|nr:hypothetical protein CFC21_039432 [Triticum aestivum]KAF7027387.1 hypothetical protein CFC21_039433 [Triticum aestivum]CDM80906.1 unnamed protein product [Triticum aestivum]